MKNTKENKQRYVAAHWGQKVLRIKADEGNDITMYVDSISIKLYETSHLLLTSLTDITDEHAIEVARICNPYFPINEDLEIEVFTNGFGRKVVSWGDSPKSKFLIEDAVNITNGADFLRKNSYALPFDGSSVDELKEYGWLKIKEQ